MTPDPSSLNSHRYLSESSQTAKILDCGGRAQRRHRFSIAGRASKAAWRFASHRSPKRFGCGLVALRLCAFAVLSRNIVPFCEDFYHRSPRATFVAQVGNLLYRRLTVGGTSKSRTRCGLPIRDTVPHCGTSLRYFGCGSAAPCLCVNFISSLLNRYG